MPALRTLGRAIRAPSLVVAAVLLGWQFPAPPALSAVTTPLVAVLVFAAVYDRNWRVSLSRTHSRFLAGSLAAVYLLPLAFAPIPMLVLDGAAQVGTLVVLVGPPTAGSAIIWSRFGGGEAVTTVLVTTAALALAPLATPTLLGLVLGRGVAVDPAPVARTLLFVVGGGVGLAWLVPEGAVGEKTLDALSLVTVALLVYVGTATTKLGSLSLWSLVAVGLTAVVFLAAAALLAVGCVSVVGRSRAISLFFATGLRNLGIGVAVATTLPVEGAIVVVVTFYVVQQLTAAVVAEGLRESVLSPLRRPQLFD